VRWIILTVLAVGTAVGLTAWWLSSGLPQLKPAQAATVRIDVIRTALAAGAGVGAAITLMLAFRRQRHHEIVAASAEHDASERRVTELYTKAAEQLGNARAPVRLAGLYALERLAQLTPDQRQTIVNVICAYLRMPYTPPSKDRHDKIRTAQRTTRFAALADSSAAAGDKDAHEERQVRLTAQRIISDHLRYTETQPPSCGHRRVADPNAGFWPNIRLDLTDATLLNFDFSNCRATHAEFDRATFTGDADFSEATFTGDAKFRETTFTGQAVFDRATFHQEAWFHSATIADTAWFIQATFNSGAVLREVTFAFADTFANSTGSARFQRATFDHGAWFDGATFTGDAEFLSAIFTGDADFSKATFTGTAWFGQAVFEFNPVFDRVQGTEKVDLTGAFVPREEGPMQLPAGWRREIGPDGFTRLQRDVPHAAPEDAMDKEHGEAN
jgi:uncharacterized protein YjbI with pentapeptide repeats